MKSFGSVTVSCVGRDQPGGYKNSCVVKYAPDL